MNNAAIQSSGSSNHGEKPSPLAVVSERVKDPHKGRAAVSAALDHDAVKEHDLL
jgi:hypothetical protein